MTKRSGTTPPMRTHSTSLATPLDTSRNLTRLAVHSARGFAGARPLGALCIHGLGNWVRGQMRSHKSQRRSRRHSGMCKRHGLRQPHR